MVVKTIEDINRARELIDRLQKLSVPESECNKLRDILNRRESQLYKKQSRCTYDTDGKCQETGWCSDGCRGN